MILGSYNLYHAIIGQQWVYDMLSDPVLRATLFSDDVVIIGVKYRGSHLYLLDTTGPQYIVEMRREGSGYHLLVFQYKKGVIRFK